MVKMQQPPGQKGSRANCQASSDACRGQSAKLFAVREGFGVGQVLFGKRNIKRFAQFVACGSVKVQSFFSDDEARGTMLE